jgi:2-iminobutanoate/2-iminopropanoate deaminase
MKKIIASPLAPKAVGPYSQAIENNGTIYVSGQLPMNHETGIMERGDIAAQTRRALHNVELVLKAAGTTKELVTMCRVYTRRGYDSCSEIR